MAGIDVVIVAPEYGYMMNLPEYQTLKHKTCYLSHITCRQYITCLANKLIVDAEYSYEIQNHPAINIVSNSIVNDGFASKSFVI